jgi:hypothetical protein
MARKQRFFTFTDGRQFPIVQTDSGQLIIKLTIEQWESLTEEEKEAVIFGDNLLAREWLGGATYYQGGPYQPGRIWEV